MRVKRGTCNFNRRATMAGQQADIESRASTPSSKPRYEAHTTRWDWLLVPESLSWKNLTSLLSRWYAAFRSFRGRIRILSSKMAEWVRLGPRYTLQGQCLLPNARTQARASSIEILRSTYDWVDSTDCRVFLMGFDVGEKYSMGYLGQPDSRVRQQVLGEMVSCDQISQVPNVGTDSSGHSRSDSQAGMDADEIIVSNVQSASGFKVP
jgi:hypothetical protein